MKKSRSTLGLLFIALLFICCVNGFSEETKKTKLPTTISSVIPPGLPNEYFPMQIGATWTYKITIGDTEPIRYDRVSYEKMTTVTRGRLFGTMESYEKGKTFALKIKIKSEAKKQGDIQYPNGRELEIIEDDLHIYDDTKKLFLASTHNDDYTIYEVFTRDHKHNMRGPWGQTTTEEGTSMRPIFFGGSPGTQISLGRKSNDHLFFAGLKKIPNKNDLGLHFVRIVDKNEKDKDDPSSKESIIDDGFTEETWFVKDQGMTLLIQRRREIVTMTWELINFQTP